MYDYDIEFLRDEEGVIHGLAVTAALGTNYSFCHLQLQRYMKSCRMDDSTVMIVPTTTPSSRDPQEKRKGLRFMDKQGGVLSMFMLPDEPNIEGTIRDLFACTGRYANTMLLLRRVDDGFMIATEEYCKTLDLLAAAA